MTTLSKSTQVVVAALALFLASCVSEFESKKELALAAGFRAITPVRPEHVELLPELPEDQITEIKFQGNTYYVLPDAENNRAYVGRSEEYQAYQQLRIQKKIAEDNLAAAQMNQMAAYNSMNWGAWGGWGGWGPVGYPYGYRRYGYYVR